MGVSISTNNGKRKTLDAELNLVPFIDLLVCCICFLLLTAVWVDLGHIEAKQKQRSAGGKANLEKTLKVAVLVGEEGYALLIGSQRLVIPKEGLVYNFEGLKEQLDLVPEIYKTRLIVAAEDGVQYRHIVKVMDFARQSSFGQLQVTDAAHQM